MEMTAVYTLWMDRAEVNSVPYSSLAKLDFLFSSKKHINVFKILAYMYYQL